MIINTVGKIILKNGQKVYKRFGAAVVLKIKLGTAAFANVVNNATTTEEGFVPDARVVAQQQETISVLQQQVDSLNSAIENVNEKFYQLKPRTFSFSSSAEIENHYDNYSNNVQNGFYYAFYINHGAGYSTLGGGSWYVEGLKTSNAYEWQRAISYNGFFYRIKNASNWGNWKKIQMT